MSGTDPDRLRRIVVVVADLNFAYFFVEFVVATAAGSVALLADSVDFLEDTAVNLRIFTSALLLGSVRHHAGSLSRVAFLSARNGVLVNVATIAMATLPTWTASGWPDLTLGAFIIALAAHAAVEVWRVSEEQRLAAKALAAEQIYRACRRSSARGIPRRRAGARGRWCEDQPAPRSATTHPACWLARFSVQVQCWVEFGSRLPSPPRESTVKTAVKMIRSPGGVLERPNAACASENASS